MRSILKGNQYGHQAGFCRAIAEAVELLTEGSKGVTHSAAGTCWGEWEQLFANSTAADYIAIAAPLNSAEALGPPTRRQKLPAEVIAAADVFPLRVGTIVCTD
jgi:hypothetical protein